MMTDAQADALIERIYKLADALKPMRKRREVPLFRRRAEVVEIRKAAPDPEAQRRGLWEHCLTVARATDNPVATLRTIVGKQAVATRLAGRHDYFATPATPPPDAGAMTVGDVAMAKINALAAKERTADPSLSQAAAIAKAMKTEAGRAAYAQYNRPDRHSTALELAAVAKRDIANVNRLRAWNATTCAQFIDDRIREIDPVAKKSVDALTATYAVVRVAFPHEWAGAREGK